MFLAIRPRHQIHYFESTRARPWRSGGFLQGALAAFPYRFRAVLADNGIAFADARRHRSGPTARHRGHAFDRLCREHGIEHHLTKPYHPWTSGQAERMNRTVKDPTINAFHHPDLETLQGMPWPSSAPTIFGKHLKALRWRTPIQAICDA